MHQIRPRRQPSILQYVTVTLDVYQVCYSVGHGVVLIKHRSESQWTVLLGYPTISTNVKCYYRFVYNNFVFQQDSAQVHFSCIHTVQLPQCKTLNFLSPELWPHNSPEFNSIDYQLQSHIAAWGWAASNKRLNKLSQRLAEVWQCNSTALSKRLLFLSFFISPGSTEALVWWGGKIKHLWLPTFSGTFVPKIIKINSCMSEL